MYFMISRPFLIFSTVLSATILLLSPHLVGSITLPYYRGFQLSSGISEFFSVDITQIPPDTHLSLSLIGLADTGPALYISLNETHQTPNDRQVADYFSTNSSRTLIFIPFQKLIEVQNIYAGLVCALDTVQCMAAFSVEYAKEIAVEPNGGKHTESASSLQSSGSAIVRFNTTFGKDIERMVIHMSALVEDINNKDPSKIKMFLTQGDEIPYDGHSAIDISEIPWFEGSTIIITRDSPLFCRACNYTMSVKFPRFASLNIEVKGFTSEIKLDDTAIFDGVAKNNSNVYVTRVIEGEHDIYLDIRMQEGSSKVFIACNGTSDNSTYGRYVIGKSKRIMLTEQRRNRCENAVYYITVYGLEDSVYTIQTTTKKMTKLAIGNGMPLKSEIESDELVSHMFYIPMGTTGKIIIALEFPDSSFGLQMDILPCRSFAECEGVFSDDIEATGLNSNKKYQMISYISGIYFDYRNKTQKVTFSIDETQNCNPLFIRDPDLSDTVMSLCAYTIQLMSSKETTIQYSLKVDIEGHQWLLEGVPQERSAEINETVYFGFSSLHTDLVEVNIELIKLSGDFEIYASRGDEKYPTKESSEAQLKEEGVITFKDDTRSNSTYYIAVKALKSGLFALKATSLRKKQESINPIGVLTIGNPLKGDIYLENGYSPRFYVFFIDLSDGWEGYIDVHVTASKEALISIAINNNGEVPLSHSSTWTSTGSSLVIYSTDISFLRQGVYYVGVYSSQADQAQGSEETGFSIEYFLSQTVSEVEDQDPADLAKSQHMFLSPSSPFHRSVERNQVDYYKIFILPRDDKVIISKDVTVGNIELFLSIAPTNEYPSEKQYNYTTKMTNRNFIELDQKTLARACITQPASLCAIYVSAVPQGTTSSYSIDLKRSFTKKSRSTAITLLEDGKEMRLPVPTDKASPEIFYFYTLPLEPSYVTVSCYRRNVVVYASLLDKDLNVTDFAHITIPSSSFYNFTSKMDPRGGDLLTIPAKTPTLVVVSVYFQDMDKYSDYPTTYSILRDSQTMPTVLGKEYKSFLNPNQYKYFTLKVGSSHYNLIISAKSLDGQELSIVAAPPNQDELPIVENSLFKKREIFGSKFLEITNDGYIGEYPDRYDYNISGTWIFGVYGQNASEFSFLALCQSQKIVELQSDETKKVLLKSNSPLYIAYKPQTKMPLNIKAKEIEKEPIYDIRQISKDQDFIFSLVNKTTVQWSTPGDIDRGNCNDCMYLITLYNAFEGRIGGLPGYVYSQEVDITISERLIQIVNASNGYPITHELTPGPSPTIALSDYGNGDIYISILSDTDKLELYTSNDSTINTTNYLWKAEIVCKNQTQILKVPRFVTYQERYLLKKSIFYVQIKNPALQNITYTLIILAENSYSINNYFYIDPAFSSALSFFTTSENEMIEIHADINPLASKQLADDTFKTIYGLEVKAYYWTEDALEIFATSVPVSRTEILDSETNRYDQKKGQIYKIASKKGKFVFVFTNTDDQRLGITKRIYASTNELQTLEMNVRVNLTLVPGRILSYQTSLIGPGVWYLSGYSCKSYYTYLNLQNYSDTSDTYITRRGSSNEHLYNMTVSKGENLTQIIRLSSEEANDMTEFVFKSIFLPGATPKNYEMKKYRWNEIEAKKDSGVISVRVSPIELEEYDTLQDTVIYEIVTCQDERRKPCKIDNTNCATNRSEEFRIQEKNQALLEVITEKSGEYYVSLIAHIKSQGQDIKTILIEEKKITVSIPAKLEEDAKPIEPKAPVVKKPVEKISNESFYQPVELSYNQPSGLAAWSDLGFIAVVLLTLVAVFAVGFIFYKKCIKKKAYQEVAIAESELSVIQQDGELIEQERSNDKLII